MACPRRPQTLEAVVASEQHPPWRACLPACRGAARAWPRTGRNSPASALAPDTVPAASSLPAPPAFCSRRPGRFQLQTLLLPTEASFMARHAFPVMPDRLCDEPDTQEFNCEPGRHLALRRVPPVGGCCSKWRSHRDRLFNLPFEGQSALLPFVEIRYDVCIAFDEQQSWNPNQFKPKHLLELLTAGRSAGRGAAGNS